MGVLNKKKFQLGCDDKARIHQKNTNNKNSIILFLHNEYSNEYETYEEFIEEEMDGDSTIVSKEQFEQAKNDDEYIKVGGIDWEFTI